MKKTLLILSMLVGLNLANAQTPVMFDNFNTSGIRANYWNFYNSNYITAPVANPSAVGNTSTEVGEYTRFVPVAANDQYQGLGCKLSLPSAYTPFAFFNSYNAVTIAVYAGQAFTLGITLQDNGATNTDVLTVTQNYTAGNVGTWQILTFDFSSVNVVGNANYHTLTSGNGYALLLKFDDGLMNTTALNYYVDNFTGITVVPTGILNGQSTNNLSQLKQNAPNPLADQTTISYSLNESAQVSLTIFDMKGIEITSLVNNQIQGSGDYNYNLNASGLQEGIYYYTLKADSFVETKKMVVKK